MLFILTHTCNPIIRLEGFEFQASLSYTMKLSLNTDTCVQYIVHGMKSDSFEKYLVLDCMFAVIVA